MHSSQRRILIVDDDPDLLALLSFTLRNAGFEVILASDGAAALRAFERHVIALVVLDVSMPELNGFAVCDGLRKHSFVPVIMLTARHHEQDQLRALDAGADAYIVKPFSPLALVARVRALLRRAPALRMPVLRSGAIALDQEGQVLIAAGQELRLTRLETRVLQMLMSHAGQIISAHRLIEEVWNHQDAANRNMLKQAIFRLRRKLTAAPFSLDTLQTARGGYLWSATVDESALADAEATATAVQSA